MDHVGAQTAHAAERYLMGELSPDDAHEFELHFFQCTDCASAIESGQALLRGVRETSRTPSNPPADESSRPKDAPA